MARSAFVDLIACLLAGSKDPAVKLLINIAAEWDGEGENLVIGSTRRYHAPWAALINATAAHALDFDDNFLPAFTHATAVLGPALLALAETHRLSGKVFLDAYLVGLELHARIGRLVNPGHFQKGWHATATVGAIGTAGACARLLGLGPEATCIAMGIAFSMAAGSKKQFGSMMKPTQAGLAAQHAVMAARMASVGMSSNPDFLTGSWSFQDLYATIDPDLETNALKALGQELALTEQGLLAKRFPCCASAHKTLDGLFALKRRHTIRQEDIERVTTRLPKTLSQNLPFRRPKNEMEARFSLPYTAARILSEGMLSLGHFTIEAVSDPEILSLSDRIQVETIQDPQTIQLEMPIYSCIELKNGTRYEIETGPLKGSKLNPLTEEELYQKLVDCARFAGIDAFPDDLYKAITSIDQLEPLSVLTQKLHGLFFKNYGTRT